MSIRIFIAAPIACARRAEHVALELAARDYVIASSWHANATNVRDPKDHEKRAELLSTNLAELCSADVLVVLADEGHPRCTYAEMGYALALCKPCVITHDSGTGRMLMDSHPLVIRLDTRLHDFADLPFTIDRAAAMIPGRDRPTDPAPPLEDLEEFDKLMRPDPEADVVTQTENPVPQDDCRMVGATRNG